MHELQEIPKAFPKNFEIVHAVNYDIREYCWVSTPGNRSCLPHATVEELGDGRVIYKHEAVLHACSAQQWNSNIHVVV